MKIKYESNFKGFLILPRGIWYFFRTTKITPVEFSLFLLIISQMDFDPRHKYYTVLLRDNKQLADILGVDISTIGRIKKRLVEKGFLQYNPETGFYTSNLFPIFISQNTKYIAGLSEAEMKEIYAINQSSAADLQNKIAEMQIYGKVQCGTMSKSKRRSRVSSKDDSSLSEDINPEDIPF